MKTGSNIKPDSAGLAVIFLANDLDCPTLTIKKAWFPPVRGIQKIIYQLIQLISTNLILRIAMTFSKTTWVLKKISGNLQQRETRDNDSDQNSWIIKNNLVVR